QHEHVGRSRAPIRDEGRGDRHDTVPDSPRHRPRPSSARQGVSPQCPFAMADPGGKLLNILSTACSVACAFDFALSDRASLAVPCQIPCLVFASKMSTTSVPTL